MMMKRGPPFALWDRSTKCKRLLHIEAGTDEDFSQKRSLLLHAELAIPDDMVKDAMEMGLREGLSPQVPHEAVHYATDEVASKTIVNTPCVVIERHARIRIAATDVS